MHVCFYLFEKNNIHLMFKHDKLYLRTRTLNHYMSQNKNINKRKLSRGITKNLECNFSLYDESSTTSYGYSGSKTKWVKMKEISISIRCHLQRF